MLLEVRHVSLRLCMRAMGVDDVVRIVAAVLKRHGVERCNFVGHSFGTLVIAHMRKIFPESVSSVLLCDPVRPCSMPSMFLSHCFEAMRGHVQPSRMQRGQMRSCHVEGPGSSKRAFLCGSLPFNLAPRG